MDMTGSYRIEAPRDRVWEALNDPAVLRECIPGCEEVEKVSDTAFTAKVKAKVGPVSARFAGKVQLSDIDPPNGYTISGEGSGGAAGFGKGGAKVRLEPDGAATTLSYEVHAQVGGKLAQIGSRLVDATARKMADDFFSRFSTLVGTPAQPVPEPAPAPATGPSLITPVVMEPQPEIPLPLPTLRTRAGGVPWLALLMAAALFVLIWAST